jgi:hypothetical protein
LLLYVVFLLVTFALRDHTLFSVAQNALYLCIIAQALFVAHLGIPILRIIFPHRADLGDIDTLADCMSLLTVLPRTPRDIIASAVYIILPIIALTANVAVVIEGPRSGGVDFVLIGLVANLFFLAAMFMARALIRYRKLWSRRSPD